MHEKQEDLKPIDRLNMTVASFSRTSRKMNHNDLKTKKIEEDAEFSPENLEDEDDFTTLEADEALITEEERNEELLALEKEGSLPLEELLKMYSSRRG
ncbi:hypothetical protein KP509_22G011200 [Ceratopteris richardii]|uniref:Uncharacterized protein n=1 Tax=Ceratopteris richardii TaxID=49495 RepID=A0A8T2S4R1_CERRI|nr:hypothetical protein KP509_22G011200 [Ceratopteris richardii]